jgi:uncharacterized protein YbjT (DUF2867 family)
MKILVTGATGNIGRMVVDELLTLGADDVRALTVNPAKAALPAGVEVVRGFLGRLETLPAAYAGVDVLYLAPHLPTAAEACRLAAKAGVRRIVDLAGAKGEHWQGIEDAVEATGLPCTHLEPGEFMANVTIWAGQIRAGDVVHDTCGDAANAPIAQEDVVDLPPAEAIGHFERAMGEHAAWYVDSLPGLVEHPQQAVPTVTEVTGRPATTLLEWTSRHADLFR